jgi:prefoldin subunit 5
MSDRMQSLLSRAVEDQLSEQRQVAGILAEVRGQLTRLDEQLQGLRGADAGVGSQQIQDALTGVGTDLREAVRIIAERVDGVARLVQQRGHDLAEIRASIDELRQSLEAHVTAIGGISGGLSALPAFGDRIEALQGGLGGLHERLGGLEELVAGVGALQQRADTTDTGLRELRHAFTGVAARIAELPPRGDIETLLSRPAEAIDGVVTRLSRLESAVPSLLERLDAIEQAGTAHGQRLDDVAQGLQAPADRTGPDRGAVEELAEAVADLRDELRARLTELSAAANAPEVADQLSGRLDALHARLDGTDELRDRVAAIADATATAASSEDVAGLVERAVADSERRLAAHVDEAVLALAEAMLRRRSSRGGRTPNTGDEEPARAVSLDQVYVDGERVSPPVDDSAAEDELIDEHELADEPEPDVGAVEDESVVPEEDAEPEDAEPEEAADQSVASNAPPTAWQTPLLTTPEQQEAPEPPRKRKAWWRPGD